MEYYIKLYKLWSAKQIYITEQFELKLSMTSIAETILDQHKDMNNFEYTSLIQDEIRFCFIDYL